MDEQDARNLLDEAEATEAQIRERLGLVNGQTFDPLKTPEVQQARATMERAEADYKRFAQLLEEGAISRSEHDLRRADYLAAKAAVRDHREPDAAALPVPPGPEGPGRHGAEGGGGHDHPRPLRRPDRREGA